MKAAMPDRTLRWILWPARRPKPVTEHIILRSGPEANLYYLCPGCRTFLPREFMRFCDNCGQPLGWDDVPEEDLC